MSLDREFYLDMLARQFRNAREAAGLTQAQAAERLDTSQGEISRLETGERRADLFRTMEIAHAYGTSLSAMMRKIVESPGTMPGDRPVIETGFFGKERADQ